MIGKLRVLLIEDDPGDARLIRGLLADLSELSIRLTSCTSLDSGLAYLETGSFDLVLSDLTLPDSCGLDTISAILTRFPAIPVIVLTGTYDRELAEQAIHLGAQDYLRKQRLAPAILHQAILYALERQRVQEALSRSEQRFRTIFEGSPLAISIVKPAGKQILTCNRAFLNMLGYDEDDLPKLSLSTLTHPDDLEAELRDFSTVSNGEQCSFTREQRLLSKDGRIIWAKTVGTVFQKDKGKPEQILVVQQDITAEKEATLELDTERKHLRSVMETMPAFLYLQAPDHTIPFANNRFREYFGDPAGRRCHAIFRNSKTPCAPCATLEVLKTRAELIREWTDNQGRVFELRERPFEATEGQEYVLVIGVEITNLIEATNAVRASEQRFRELAEMVPEIVFECSLEGDLTFANQAGFKHFGYSEQQFNDGLNAFNMVVDDDLDRIRASVERLLAGGEEHSSRYTAQRSDGSTFPVTIHSSLIRQQGQPVGLRGIIVDITAQVEAQQATRESEARHRQLFESAPMGIGYHSIDGETLAINATAVSRLKGNSEDYLGRNIADYYQDPEEVRRRFALALESPEHHTYEDCVERQDAVLWYQRTYTAVRNASGEPVGVQVISNDITAQVEAQQAFAESESRLRAVLDTVPDLLFQLDADDRVCMYHAPPEELYVRPEEFLGTKLGATLPKESAVKMIKALQDLKQTGKMQMVEYSIPIQGVMKDYEARLIRGDIGRTLIMIRDISARKQALKALEVADDILRHTPIGMFIFQHEEPDRLVLVDTNPEAERLTGIALSEWIGRELNEIWPDARAVGLANAYLSAYTNSTFFNSDSLSQESLHATGKYRIRAFRIPDARLVVSFEDMSEQMDAQRKLQESERRNRSIVETSPVGILTVDIKGTITSANRAFFAMTGYEANELVGKHFTKIPAIRVKDLPKYVRTFRSLLTGKIPEPFESSWTTKDGRVRHGEIQVALMQTADKAWSAQVNVQDVTDRREAQEALRMSEEQYRSLFENAALGIYRTTPDGRILAANGALIRMLRYDSFEQLAKRNLEHEGFESSSPRSEFKRFMEDAGRVDGLESSWRRRDGSRIFVREHAYAVRDSSGNIAWYEGTLEDITDRKAAEIALRQSEENYRTIFNSGNDAILLHDAVTGQLLDANDKIQEMFGYSVAELLELQVGDFSSGEPPYTQEEALRRIHAAADGTPQVFEWHCRKRSGELFWIEVSLQQVTLLGRSVVQAVDRDISERKAFEAQLRQSQKLESIGTLASGVAHEINNPLMGMINYAELISSRVENEVLQEYAEGIKEEGDRVAKIVRNLLSFSRQDQEQHSPARMVDIVAASLSLIGSLLRKDFIQVEIDVPENLPIVRCRSQQMQQVFINLVTNARDSLNTKYTTAHADKKLCITSRVLHERDQSWLRSTIEDFGNGIPEDVASRIFDPFFTTKARNEGTGLGLSISYGIVRDHNGQLTVESEPGQFTRFHVDLPLADGT